MIAEELLELALKALPGAEIDVNVGREELALTRFANSHIHQNVSGEVTNVRLRAHRDGRTVVTTSTVTDQDGLSSLVDRTVAAIGAAPLDPGWPGLTAPQPARGAGLLDEATRHATPGDRAMRVRAFVDSADGLETAGYCRTRYRSSAYRNSLGHSIEGAATTADMDGIVRRAGADAVARRAGYRLADVDGAQLGGRAYRSVMTQGNAVDLPPGRYEVILQPEAVGDLLMNLGHFGFNGKWHHEGRTFVQLGVAQLDEAITLVDDPFHPGTPGEVYDHEGTPKGTLTVVDKGVSTAVVYDRRSAALAGAVSTGHALPDDPGYGCAAENLGFVPGTSTVDDMIRGMRRGLLIGDFWYTRILDPRRLSITGLTRNGVWLVENGEVVAPVTNLRFTQSYPAALAPGQVLGIGSELIAQPARWNLASWNAPALHLASWNFTGNAAG